MKELTEEQKENIKNGALAVFRYLLNLAVCVILAVLTLLVGFVPVLNTWFLTRLFNGRKEEVLRELWK